MPDLDTAVAVSNEYAPEHLIIQTREPRALLPQVENAGSVFLGEWSPESDGRLLLRHQSRAADLRLRAQLQRPVAARLQKRITVQELSADGLRALGPTAITLAGWKASMRTAAP